jgi:predicted ATPase
VVAYLDFFNTPYEAAFTTICENNPYDTVFILEPWEAIFTKDNERYESFHEALRIDKALKHTYKRLGYEPVVVPKCAVIERVTFIEQYLKL